MSGVTILMIPTMSRDGSREVANSGRSSGITGSRNCLEGLRKLIIPLIISLETLICPKIVRESIFQECRTNGKWTFKKEN